MNLMSDIFVHSKMFFIYLVLYTFCSVLADDDYTVSIIKLSSPENTAICDDVSLACHIFPVNSLVLWRFNGENITENNRISINVTDLENHRISRLNIKCASIKDTGNYTCRTFLPENNEIADEKNISLNVILEGEVVDKESRKIRVNESATLSCLMKGYPLESVEWSIEKSGLSELLPENIHTYYPNNTYAVTLLNFTNVNHHDNGSYLCKAVGPSGPFNASVHLFVLNKPQVIIDLVKAVGAKMLYVNWTVNDGNDPISQFFIQTMKNGTNQWTFYPKHISGGNTSFLIQNLDVNTAYKIRLRAKNSIGTSTDNEYHSWVSTLSKDPMFVPTVTIKGGTSNGFNIGWTAPPPDVRDYVHYYEIMLERNGTKRETVQLASEGNGYVFNDLRPFTEYTFKIAACSEFTKKCGNWSKEVNGTTLDGISDPPENITVQCRFDNISHASFVLVTWQPPTNPYGTIQHYNVQLEGTAMFRNENGVYVNDTWGPKIRRVKEKSTDARFDVVPSNTNYTIKVSAVTKSRHIGKQAEQYCSMPPTVPEKEKLSRFSWNKVMSEKGRWLFKLHLPRISERNGAICCYKIYLVKLAFGQRVNDLPSPEELTILTYHQVHYNISGGAYIAEKFDSATLDKEIFLGDGSIHNSDKACQQCVIVTDKKPVRTTTMLPTTAELALAEISGLNIPVSDPPDIYETSSEEYVETTIIPARFQRSAQAESHVVVDVTQGYENLANDGVLDPNFNYTGFIKILVFGEHGSIIPAYSSYFVPMFPAQSVIEIASDSPELTIAVYILIALVVVVLVLLIILFVLHNYTKSVAEEQGIEMTFTNTLMHLCRNVGGRHVPVSSSPPDMPPIAKEELAAAVAERHKDSDYGFQREFEMLPDRFPDRTTRASESRDNFYKNRYPDIKAYDQTRVRLAQIDGIAGSDYINANFVVGYKERKKFICAQGPMDNTVNDFWRMVWEQHLEMILMLTNLEEYSKTKCAKYWPDSNGGEKKFGDFVVNHVQEKRFSDYIVRELKLYQVSGDGNEKEKGEERSIIQYHFLVWKDFQAPDHPSGILKFIRRINADYSLEKGPILIHCSAGVGRTGTLVALDSLVQQLSEENQVAVFNTVCDLRHQRNFLVQSLKQYIFVYRALLEVSQSGDTELNVASLKSSVEKLRRTENGKDRCLLEEEFEKLELVVDERGKSWSVGGGDENKPKNRSQEVIPYDRNRVMLTPIPGKDHSTYINASFIEGYDNSESFIITQDPLLVTLSDFWRMISEQCISTLIMLSDLGEGPKKCIRYWPEPDDECTYDNIRVKYIQSESCPYYTRREFAVTNIKTDDSIITTQFQYNGWPTVEGEVPEVTRGLIELVDQTQENHALAVADGNPGPIAVHCNWGAERSSIFVALSILVQQLKTEKSVDIFSTVRKLRSQRQLMMKNYAQYEFLHRAIVNYADLHHMTENGTTSPI